MNHTFLFSWNPIKFPWPELEEICIRLKNGKSVREDWTCASHKKIKPGDRAFVTYVGAEPRGIFASGFISSEPFPGKNHKGNDAYRVWITLDVLLNPRKESILTLDILKVGRLEKQLWTAQASGILIKPEFTEELEALWKDFLGSENNLIK